MDTKNVLVPVDFSPTSTLAVNYGIALARRLKSKLTLLHVVESPTASMYTFPGEADKIEKKSCEQAQRLLPALVAPEDQDDLDLQVVVRKGEIEQEIRSAIREQAADLVVMGTHSRGLIGRWLIGSVTQHLLRKLSVPILTVSHAYRPLEFTRILFATDLLESSKEAFRFALELAGTTRSHLVVAHVLDERAQLTSETPGIETIREESHRLLLEDITVRFSDMESQAAKQNLRIETILIEGIPSETILKIADENDIDLIVLSVKMKGVVERAILGSTAERVVREARVPVLSIPVGVNAEQ